MLANKDSEIGTIAAIGPVGSPPPSKYDRLIAKAKEVPAAATVVVYPCDENSLRGAIEAAEAGIIRPILVGPARKLRPSLASMILIQPLRDRRRTGQRGCGGEGCRVDPSSQG